MNRTLLFMLLFAALSVKSFAQNMDCSNAILLCDQSPVLIEKVTSAGAKPETNATPPLTSDLPETNPIYFKWRVAKAGKLTFLIAPNDPMDDLDFVLFRLGTDGACNELNKVAQMTEGPTLGEGHPPIGHCKGSTGLRDPHTVVAAPNGCDDSHYFLEPLDAQAGTWYLLYVNNFRSSGGFRLSFEGDARFDANVGNCLSVSSVEDIVTANIAFSKISPNPTNGAASLVVTTHAAAIGKISIVDVVGRIVRTANFKVESGTNHVDIPSEGLESGIFSVFLAVDNQTHVATLVKI